jgi:hypothetical protein
MLVIGVSGRAFAGPIGVLYLTTPYGLFSLQGDQVTKLATSPEDAEPIAVINTIRTMGTYPNFGPGGQTGVEYQLDGTPTGITIPTAHVGLCFFDGATDGTHNFAYDFCGGQVVEYDANWQNPVNYPPSLFRLEPNAYLGITYDPTNNSLWLTGYAQGGFIADFTLTGSLITSFSSDPASPFGLALDPADQTLWVNDGVGNFYQYSKSGVLLSHAYYQALFFGGGQALARGGEFQLQGPATVPEPTTVLLIGMGLAMVARNRKKHASAQ